MEIFINGKPADITLDTEKTLGDVLSGIELWLSGTGNRIGQINIDGSDIPWNDLGRFFSNDLKSLVKLDIEVSSFRELAAEALTALIGVCSLHILSPFEERAQITSYWEKSAAAQFLDTEMPDIYKLAGASFTGEGFSTQDLKTIIEERLRETTDPHNEICGIELILKNISERLVQLPLDMQTGKDKKAAETIQLFSEIGEKLFRILAIFKSTGLSMDTLIIDGKSARIFIDEFKKAIQELSGAYKDQDTVLAGDIAEYELAPRLIKFFNSLKEIKIPNLTVVT